MTTAASVLQRSVRWSNRQSADVGPSANSTHSANLYRTSSVRRYMAPLEKAGVAKVEITPEGPIWMAGYAARKHPSEGVVAPLYAKALAID
ncbi:MAG: hypothetical protein ACK6EB_34705, partial [Planctomyces sp.]